MFSSTEKYKINRQGLKALAVICILLVIPFKAGGQDIAKPEDARTAALDQKIPIGPNVTVGELDNGLRYFIRENGRPENRAELRLVVNVGSIVEDGDQLGLAHFVEHMAFNGTTHFKKQELVDFMESIGMRFGPGLNAGTSFDETIYTMRIPTDSSEVIETAFQILEDWAHGLTFDAEEISKERGVVIEEWRLGRGAGTRIRDKQFPILLKDSRYAERLPIGSMEALESFDDEALKRFYSDWYRPDLMAVIAVGNFDKSLIESLIKQHFMNIPRAVNPRPRIMYGVPDHEETLFAIATDKELAGTSVSVFYKLALRDHSTIRAYRQSIVEGLYNGMFNRRLSELTQKAEPPFLGGSSSRGLFIRSKEVYTLGAAVKEDGIELGLGTLLVEAERVARHGFTVTELERQKILLLRSIERAYSERDKQNSGTYASEYIRSFLYGESIPGIEYEFELFKRSVPEITIEEVNSLARAWISDKNRVIMVSSPEKEGLRVPTEDELLTVFESIADKEIEPYVDTIADQPLVGNEPIPGEIVSENTIEEIGITEWELSNGVRVILKATDFKEDQILFQAFSPGGHSLSSDENYIPASSAVSVVSAGGLANFNAIELGKLLTGKIASASPFIGSLEEGLSGSASPRDTETLFQLIYLRFTAPRKDETIFQSLQNRMRAVLANRSASPAAAFSDTLQAIMSQGHPRARQIGLNLIDEMDLDRSFEFYKDRFADAGDFTFIFVGNIDMETIRPLVRQYLGGLPTAGRVETWRDVGIEPPEGIIRKIVYKGVEPQSQTIIVFTGDLEYSRENQYAMLSMTQLLGIRLREKLREDLGGTYGVGVSHSLSWRPDEEYILMISFGSDPDSAEVLAEVIFKNIEDLKNSGATEKNLQKVGEAQRRTRETNLKTNGYWRDQLAAWYRSNKDPRNILNYEELIDGLSSQIIQDIARKTFNMNNYVQVSLFPETKK